MYATFQPATLAEASQSALDPNEWLSFKLKQRTQLTHNTALFRFALDNPSQVVGLPVASCLLTRAHMGTKDDGSPSFAVRPYTPISPPDARGYFDLIIKVYPDGKMTQHLSSLKVGDALDVKGPIIKLPYKPNMKKIIGMVAGGTGITPMLQVCPCMKIVGALFGVLLVHCWVFVGAPQNHAHHRSLRKCCATLVIPPSCAWYLPT